jgi:hypothetical protein
MEAENLFVIENKSFILDRDGSYYGHTTLADVYQCRRRMLLEHLYSLPESDIRDTIEKLFLEAFNRRYFEAQSNLAHEFLRGKIVSVSGGTVKGDLDPNKMYVYWTGVPDWSDIKENPGTILVLSYGDDCIARILINVETKIKIIGTIN